MLASAYDFLGFLNDVDNGLEQALRVQLLRGGGPFSAKLNVLAVVVLILNHVLPQAELGLTLF